MKLHHFIQKHPVPVKERVQELGRLLSKAPATVTESKRKTESKRIEAEDTEADSLLQAMRDYSVQQLEKTNPLIHKKHKHYD